MTRPIKFRAWDEVLNEMIYPSGLCAFLEEHFDFQDGEFKAVPGKKAVLLQSIGLFDKNGTEIYEGDILKKDHSEVEQFLPKGESRWLVEWSEKGFKDNMIGMEVIPYDETEVIGNIYENPGLLQ